MDAKRFNDIRRILFSVVHNPLKGFPVAFEYLEKYQSELGLPCYFGLKAELKFYQKYGKEFALTVAGDMGEHADFAGQVGAQPTRFDVTTNLSFKRFEDYEPHIGHGICYKIVVVDSNNFEVRDIVNLSFNRCNICGGYLIPSIILLDQNYSRRGEPTWTNDQLLVDVCIGCSAMNMRDRFVHYGIQSSSEFMDNFDLTDEEEYAYAISAHNNHLVETYKYFRRSYCDSIMALGQNSYKMLTPDGDGYWSVSFNFVNDVVANVMPEEIESEPEI